MPIPEVISLRPRRRLKTLDAWQTRVGEECIKSYPLPLPLWGRSSSHRVSLLIGPSKFEHGGNPEPCGPEYSHYTLYECCYSH